MPRESCSLSNQHLTPTMATDVRSAAVVVCERRGSIAGALRRQLHVHVPLVETRTVADCLAALLSWPASLLVAEAEAGELDRTLRLLTSAACEFPLARSIVVADRALERAEAVLREVGAVHVQFGLRGVSELLRIIHRHAPEFRFPPTLLEETCKRLPWGND